METNCIQSLRRRSTKLCKAFTRDTVMVLAEPRPKNMSTPLSSRSEAALNCCPSPTATMEKLFAISTPLQSKKIFQGSSSSSFETEVGPRQLSFACSPSVALYPRVTKKSVKSQSQSFEIAEDPDMSQALPAILGSLPHREGLAQPAPPAHTEAISDQSLSHLREHNCTEHVISVHPNNLSTDITVHPDADNDDGMHDTDSILSDNTCFSAFSAVSNAANLSCARSEDNLRSPLSQIPSSRSFHTPKTSQNKRAPSISPSTTLRGSQRARQNGGTTNLLLDFTQRYDSKAKDLQRSPIGQGGYFQKTTTQPNLPSYLDSQRNPSPSKPHLATPGGRKSFITLLDFDLPPQPTPRSVPTITIRELESLKSQHLSEVSSLRASLSGKEAEVESLKRAVSDAERRAGEAQEQVREERSTREHSEREKGEWEKRGKEVEDVLQQVREEFLYAEKEKEELLAKLGESNRVREEAETRLASCNQRTTFSDNVVGVPGEEEMKSPQSGEGMIARLVNEQLDEKMESLARELHQVYKRKHEAKVGILKKTYEAKSDKRCAELQQKLDEALKQNEKNQVGRDATMSGATTRSNLPGAGDSDILLLLRTQSAELEEKRAELAEMREEMEGVQNSYAKMAQDLNQERVEKGELVTAVDEMLNLQADIGTPVVVDLRKSITRPPSGLRAPTLPGSRCGIPSKSKIMSNIEKMGSAKH